MRSSIFTLYSSVTEYTKHSVTLSCNGKTQHIKLFKVTERTNLRKSTQQILFNILFNIVSGKHRFIISLGKVEQGGDRNHFEKGNRD